MARSSVGVGVCWCLGGKCHVVCAGKLAAACACGSVRYIAVWESMY